MCGTHTSRIALGHNDSSYDVMPGMTSTENLAPTQGMFSEENLASMQGVFSVENLAPSQGMFSKENLAPTQSYCSCQWAFPLKILPTQYLPMKTLPHTLLTVQMWPHSMKPPSLAHTAHCWERAKEVSLLFFSQNSFFHYRYTIDSKLPIP